MKLPEDRKALYHLVWSLPTTEIINRYCITDEQLAKHCSHFRVPRPLIGYWKAKEKGVAPAIPPLPEYIGDDGLQLKENVTTISVKESTASFGTVKKNTRIKGNKGGVKKVVCDGEHRLIKEARLYFKSGRKNYEGYYKPSKRKLIDLIVSETGFDKSLLFASTFFNECLNIGYDIGFDDHGTANRPKIDVRELDHKNNNQWSNLWKPCSSTILLIDNIKIGLTIIEMTENVPAKWVSGEYVRVKPGAKSRRTEQYGWISNHDLPSGRLCLFAYSPYYGTDWQKKWKETETKSLNDSIQSIIRDLTKSVSEIAVQIKNAEYEREQEKLRWQAMEEKWRKEKMLKKQSEAYYKSKNDLLSIMEQWAEKKRTEQFFKDLETEVVNSNIKNPEDVFERMALARQFLSKATLIESLINWKSPEEILDADEEYGK
ncbi:hypothetical protein FNN89_06815 [Salmonella enterica subsp. salamae]|nr:hypothetical protein [Salmonella enterica subsp. salamae]